MFTCTIIKLAGAILSKLAGIQSLFFRHFSKTLCVVIWLSAGHSHLNLGFYHHSLQLGCLLESYTLNPNAVHLRFILPFVFNEEETGGGAHSQLLFMLTVKRLDVSSAPQCERGQCPKQTVESDNGSAALSAPKYLIRGAEEGTV